MKFSKHFFTYILFFLMIIVGIISYYRFMIKHDYIVGYEGKCEIATNNCFVGCDDDTCTNKYYYSKIQKYAPDLYKECGKDITECEAANVCLPNDRKCSIIFCDEKIDGSICSSPINDINNINYTKI